MCYSSFFYYGSSVLTGISLSFLLSPNPEQPVKREDKPLKWNHNEVAPAPVEPYKVKIKTNEKTRFFLEVDFKTFNESDPTIVDIELDPDNDRLVKTLTGKPGNKIHIAK